MIFSYNSLVLLTVCGIKSLARLWMLITFGWMKLQQQGLHYWNVSAFHSIIINDFVDLGKIFLGSLKKCQGVLIRWWHRNATDILGNVVLKICTIFIQLHPAKSCLVWSPKPTRIILHSSKMAKKLGPSGQFHSSSFALFKANDPLTH